ncbi:MAG: gamma-glutamyl-phosphate reductase, partial [Coprococcus sp.]
MYLEEIGQKAKIASRYMAKCSQQLKNDALLKVAEDLLKNQENIIKANKIDIENAKANGMTEALLDRLTLTSDRFLGMAEGIRQVVQLEDPIGEVISMKKRPNGLMIGQQRVPMGVIGIIYESRPNVTVDAFALTFKTGNAVILRGGSDCINSNIALVNTIRDSLKELGINENAITLIEKTD